MGTVWRVFAYLKRYPLLALGTPIFTPYLEITHLEDYALKVVNIAAPQENRFQYSD